ncbi:hypothetical protein A1O1_01547 [Capronia coronata CBS 617.96]|uniref:RalA-binding protein 1 n=1 Tax=Capronia coronata CBS 617.96 TaxID=1182541 RepID=W9Z4B4_9EURO|nr:uncharacterized protein A1O1_01547 [Capronia coronata CBS 617.96]EXJ96421.1 hypothetical protein A1O1_01547 [Capronia coronata CBS 617.96]
MLQPTSNRPTPSPQTRLNQTAAAVSASSLANAHSYIGSRNPGPPVLGNSLIARDYLSSRSSSKSDLHQRGRDPQDYGSHGMRTVSDGSEKSSATQVLQREAVLKAERQPDTPATRLEDIVHSTEESQPGSQDRFSPEQTNNPLLESPRSYASSSSSAYRPNTMPRTSSIDSAISSISHVSHVQKQSGEAKYPSQEEVQHLIATAGTAENLIQHLLRDKSHAAAQNGQLWKLVDKQRAVLLGLNKDLERLTKERDRYKRKVRELQAQPSAEPDDRLRGGDGHSLQSVGDASLESKEIEPVDVWGLGMGVEQKTSSTLRGNQSTGSPVDVAMIPRPLQLEPAAQLDIRSALSAQPTFSLTEATPLAERAPKSFQPSRKAPPKPLDLRHTKDDLSSSRLIVADESVLVSDGDEDEDGEDRQPVSRGRRKTREEDDLDRELLVLNEREARSRSKKVKKNKREPAEAELQHKSPEPPSSLPPAQLHKSQDHLSPSSTISQGSSAQLSLPLRSPGLPLSPRPVANNLTGASLPLSPRGPNGNFPLSPRAPKQPLPLPTTPGQQAPTPDAQQKTDPLPLTKMNTNSTTTDSDRSQIDDSPLSPSDIPPVSRKLASPTWPDFLLPPNALPSIQVKVASSRLRPSRNSILGLKPQEENSVFILSIFERATTSELWRVQKVPASLPILDQQLRSRSTDLPKMPDRKLFSGHSPAVLDARKTSIETYFEDLLDTPLDEHAAAMICRFMSTDVMESRPHLRGQKDVTDGDKAARGMQGSGVPTKSGYLTKKGKNFGGWKSRYFVLDSPELRYFEAPGGAHLGTIKLLSARIGRQSQTDSATHPEVDPENQYRHAFLILEPKRKDMNSHVRHVLCAESDAERDEWVETLLHYIDERLEEPRSQYGAGVHTALAKEAKAFHRPGTDDIESRLTGSSSLNEANSDTPSPSNASANTSEGTQEPGSSTKPFTISGPMNGTVISDLGLWGNKAAGNGGSREREQKKRNIFHFGKPSHEPVGHGQTNQAKRTETAGHRSGHVRPVFGMQLQEAVECYSPVDVDVFLPAVVYRSIEYLRAKKASNEEGLFRLSGSNIVIRQLKDRFNSEGDVNLLADEEEYDVHAVASLFKTYLRELPSTLLTRELHLEFLKVLELNDKSQKVVAFNALVHQLPPANFSLLRTLSQYLLEVVQNADRNKMSVKNVGIVFSPTLNIPAPVFSMFLTDFGAIFEATSDEDSLRSIEIEREGALTPEDIRSPRRQLFTDLPTPMYNQNSFLQNAVTTTAAPGGGGPLEQHLDVSTDIGFSPIPTSYETRSYVTIPQETSTPSRYPPPQPPQRDNKYGGVNNMLMPDHAASVKAKRRESSMLFM